MAAGLLVALAAVGGGASGWGEARAPLEPGGGGSIPIVPPVGAGRGRSDDDEPWKGIEQDHR